MEDRSGLQQPRILYQARLSFRIEGELKTFLDRQNLKELVTTKPPLQEIIKGALCNITRNTNSTGNTLAPNSYFPVITLNANGLNHLIKRQWVSEWIKKTKTHLYDAYRRLTLNLNTSAYSK